MNFVIAARASVIKSESFLNKIFYNILVYFVDHKPEEKKIGKKNGTNDAILRHRTLFNS